MKNRKLRTFAYVIVILLGIVCYLIPINSPTFPSVFERLGISLTTAGIIAIIFEIVLKNEFINKIKSEFDSDLKILGKGYELSKHYIVEFNKAERQIDIIALTFTLGIKGYDKEILKKITKERCRVTINLDFVYYTDSE